MSSSAYEVNFDGLVGPTHNYAGLAYGNLASMEHGHSESRPRAAALEGLAKMKLMMDLGLQQGILIPHERPHVPTLMRLGFSGSDECAVEKAAKEAPEIFSACCSASAMWTANAATVAPSVDAQDGRVHITPANLTSQLHRSIEARFTTRVLRTLFSNDNHFAVHEPLPPGQTFGDEGAANHTRFSAEHRGPGAHLFVYGRTELSAAGHGPQTFPARQTLEASHAIARLHELAAGQAVFALQNPELIDAGVFHNDVISVGNERAFVYHEAAFAETERVIEEVRSCVNSVCGCEPVFVEVTEAELTPAAAVSSYLFNSQLVTLPDSSMRLIAPMESYEDPAARSVIERIISENNPISDVDYVDLRQSMKNGGGPACLRLRVVLTESEMAALHPGALLTPDLYDRLTAWVEKHYRESLQATDLADPLLLRESRGALDGLTQMLGLGSVYEFQR